MKKIVIALMLFLSMSTGVLANGDSQLYKGEITEASRSETNPGVIDFKAKVVILDGERKGDEVVINQQLLTGETTIEYKKGDKVLLTEAKDLDGGETFYITDYYRSDVLLLLFGLFILVTVIVAGKHGFRAVISMIISFIIISQITLPMIIAGRDAIFVTTITSLILIPTIFYISHGFTKKAHIAIIGVLAAIIVTSLLTRIFVNLTNITGLTDDDTIFLQFFNGGSFDLKSIYIAGVIISLSGILDDATISQVSIVQQLNETNKKMKAFDLYKRAMEVGKDHISSMVNTLVLVYAGSSLPLLILFTNSQYPLGQLVNLEVITEEVVRTLVGSIGLIIAIPITTYIAANYYGKEN